ncbi:lysosomal-trafficking regulator isoform X3 [Scyliorhinus canicula]|uniref:lysosomal-trafficking regulator isoform X3 n=1 Tax=Scyliorhinus canicula TaxID=7830 RepID=UPI0018F6B9A3|nr:lysosomal-trafficking regulator isoform X3 [Scyliorhinus canicula]
MPRSPSANLNFSLSHAWERYLQSEQEEQVRVDCLDRFLTLFYYHKGNLDASEVISFCSDMSSACNTLAREFLTDVHQLCNAVVQRPEGKEEEDESHMVALGEYLVRGRGYLLLSTLDSIIDQELTCREELLTLLLSLLPLVWKIPVQEERAPDYNLSALEHLLFTKETKYSATKSPQEKTAHILDGSSVLFAQVPSRCSTSNWKTRRQRRNTHRYSLRDTRKTPLSTSDSDTTSDDKSSVMIRQRRQQTLQPFISCQSREDNNSSKDSFPPSLKVEEVAQNNLSLEYTATPLQEVDVESSMLSKMENTPFDLCHVLLSLLEKVCKFDMALNHNPALAANVVPTLTEFLSGFGDCCNGNVSDAEEVAAGWMPEPAALVQRMLLRTVLHLMFVDINCRGNMPDTLRRNIADLLKVTLKIKNCIEKRPDPFVPLPKKTFQELSEDFSFSRSRHEVLLVPELLEVVLQILICTLQTASSNPFFFSQAMDLVHEFTQHHGFELFEGTVLQMERLVTKDEPKSTEAAEHIKSLISSVMKIISIVKKVKSEQVHQSVCTRKRHRRCEYSQFMHHHRDLSGLPVAAFKNQQSKSPFEETLDGEVCYPDRCCCIAVCAHQCLHLLQEVCLSSTCLQILSGMHTVGICCCMDPRSIIGPMLYAIKSQTLKNCQQHILSILSKFILEQLGGEEASERMKHVSCNICTIDSSQVPDIAEILHGGLTDVSSSSNPANPIYRADGILPIGGSREMLWTWEVLEAYQDLLFIDDTQLSLQIASHICHLIQKGNVVVKWQLYTHIFNTVLQRGVELSHHAQQLGLATASIEAYSHHSKHLSQDVLQLHLHTLPSLFKSRIVRDLFLSCSGLNQMTELVYLDSVRPYALKVFETLILCLGDQQLDAEMQGEETDTEDSTLDPSDTPSSQHTALHKSEMQQSLSKFYAVLKESYPKKKKTKIIDVHLNVINLFLCVAFLCVSQEPEPDCDSVNDSEDTSGYDSTASEPLCNMLPHLSPDSVILPSQKQIRQAADVWSVCRWIYLNNMVFQKQFHKLGGLGICRRLMTIIIQQISSTRKDNIKENKVNRFTQGENQKDPEIVSHSASSLMVKKDLSDISSSEESVKPEPEIIEQATVFGNQLDKQTLEDDEMPKDWDDVEQEQRRTEEDWALQSIRLLESLLAICLHTSRKTDLEPPPQNLSLDEIVTEMRDLLAHSGIVDSDLAKPLFDSLQSVSLGGSPVDCSAEQQRKKQQKINSDSALQMGDLSEETEEPQYCNMRIFAEEEGYEADSESNPEEISAKEEDGKLIAQSSSYLCNITEGTGQRELIYPEICMLELALLSASNPSLDVLIHVFRNLLEVVQHSEKNATSIYQQGAVKIIVRGFQNILSQSEMAFEECQAVLVELLVTLISSRLSAEELTFFMRLFLEKTPPTKILLGGILRIVEANVDMIPMQYLSFPTLFSTTSFSTISTIQKTNTTPTSKSSSLLKRVKFPQRQRETESEGYTHQLSSPWHVAPLHLPLVGQNSWPHMSDGFSISLWLKVEVTSGPDGPLEKTKKQRRNHLATFRESSFDGTEYEKTAGLECCSTPNSGDKLVEDGCLHVISLGSKVIMLQVWADLNTGGFTFRICIDPNDDLKAGLLAQAESQENILTPGKWQHLALSYVQQSESKKSIHGKLSLWVSGQRKPDVALGYTVPRKSSLSSDSNKTFAMIGHSITHQEDAARLAGMWSLGSLLLFNGARIGPVEAYHLFVCGPDITSVMPCKYGQPQANYSKYVTLEILQCDQISEFLMKYKEVDIGPLVDNLAIVYNPRCPAQYTIYEPVIRLKGQTRTVTSQRPFSLKDIQSNVMKPQQLKNLKPLEHQELQRILHEVGGTGAFIFLFARSVEINDCEKTQALALKVVLTLTKYNQQRIQEMESCHGYAMIHQVLIKMKCIVGFHILKALLDGCCSAPILTFNESMGQFEIDTESSAVIQDVKLLSELLLDWKIWSKAQNGVWETLMAALEVLIQVHHPKQMFNVKQFLKAQVVYRFLLTCQVLQEHRDEHLRSIPREVCRSFVKIIEEVLGSPPDLELLKLVYNFLLAVHPPTNTYVCHTPPGFYFSLHIDGKIFDEKVKSIMHMRHSNSSGKPSDSPGFLSPPTFTAVQTDAIINPPAPRTSGHSSDVRLDGDKCQSTLNYPKQESPLLPLYEQDSQSLPVTPSTSPQVRIRRLTSRVERNFADLREVSECESDSLAFLPESAPNMGAVETLKDEMYLSSCESAKTLCESTKEASARGDADGHIQDALEPLVQLDNLTNVISRVGCEHTANESNSISSTLEPELKQEGAGDEGINRPDSLRGLQTFQRSQSNFTSLGLAFPSQNGSLVMTRLPSIADKNLIPEEWESIGFSPLYERPYNETDTAAERFATEDSLILICCGLYNLLRGILLILPDVMLADVMDKLIQPEALIVLVNHPTPVIQQGVIKLLDAYFARASKDQKEKFLKNHGFSLLANQLYLHQGAEGLLECFLEMLLGRAVHLDEELDPETMAHIDPFRKRCIIPILGLIENSLYENALVHNKLCILLQLLNACPKLADILLDNGLLYVLFNTLATLNGLENGIPVNEYKLLLCDIQQLLVAITIHSCSSSGLPYFRIIEDLISLLGYLQTSKDTKTKEMAVALQFRVLQSAIEFIKNTANQDAQNMSSSFNLPATQHHAIHQKRKSIAGSIALKDSIIPRLPRQHFSSYSHLPMTYCFNLVSQESPLESPTGSTSYTFPTEAGPRRFSAAPSDTLMMQMRSVASDELSVLMQRRMSHDNSMRASETEFVQRLQRLTVLSVNRLIYQDPDRDILDLLSISEYPHHRISTPPGEGSEEGASGLPSNNIKMFQKEMLKLMVEGIKISLGAGRNSPPRQQWKRMLWSCRETFRSQLGRLLVHVLCPARPLEERKMALEIVYEPSHQEILRECLGQPLEHGPKLALYLYELMHDHMEALTNEQQSAAGNFFSSLKLCGYKCIPLGAPPKPDLIKAIKEEQTKYENEECANKAAWEKKMTTSQQSLLQRLDLKSKDISKIAAEITQNISLHQGMERKKVIQHIRGMYKVDLSASRHWQELVQQLTHDRAIWYDPVSYPTSWQLDPTEGPNRERRRLQRCYLTIPNKYLLTDRQKPEELLKPPLSFLFEDKSHSSFSSTVKDKATSEPIRFIRKCTNVAPSRETLGELLLGESGMYFVEDNAADAFEHPSTAVETEPASFSWTYEEIKEIHKRWWQLRDNALEIFLTNGRTLLLAFDNAKVRDDVHHNILTSSLPNLLEYGNISALTQLWCSGQITNFEYLTHLNKHAGRSFNDLMQYPVFPFILSDYSKETVDLNDPSIYRNLLKPIAVQSKEKEDRYVDNYKYLEEEYRKGAQEDDPMPPVQPYHYGSHYSNSGTVLHFLVRMPPFTKMFLAYQDQSFDIPDRTFHSMNTTWRLSSYESMTDVKELIPEFFYLPEFLVNREGFDFGMRQNGERVNHVNLPPWARNDPRLFILIHRQALESDHVSQTICNWIDLVFGNKQKGRAAVHAINVFHPATYFGMDVSAVEDPVQRRALETMIKTYGQTPRQLFTYAHPSRHGPRLSMEGELPAAMGLLVQFAFRESREHAKEVIYPSPLPWIHGLKWGEYVGSPSSPDPVVCFSQPHGEQFGSLLALPTRAICGLSRKFCLMMIYSKEQGVRSMHSTDIQWSAILSWGYADNMLRLKSKQSEPPINFIQCSPLHQVTSCAWVPDSCQLFTGSKCGVVTAYSNRFTSSMSSEIEVEAKVHLYGHTAEVTSLCVCKPYSILISVSKDGSCIIWDLNRLCYVQSLTGHKNPVTAVSTSETTGDSATVCDSVGGGSDLRLWTVNGDLSGHVHCREIICSIAFSNQPEGVSVNVIAGGLENGVVRLWSTWDLKPVREITFPKSNQPIVSLTFSCDGHHLFTANSDGTVIAWCRKDQQRMKLPMFYSFLSSYAAG